MFVNSDSAAAYLAFEKTASTYDIERERLIPGCYDFYRWAVELLPSTARNILDLGAGTGLLAAMLRKRFPLAKLHLIDISESMLERARTRFLDDSRVTYESTDYATVPLTGRWDAVVSALSIHHLRHEAKQSVFSEIYASLAPCGTFVNAEQVLGPTSNLESRYISVWLEQVRALGATEKQIAESLTRQEADRCASVEDNLRWMREAGFIQVDCWWKSGRFAVLAGTKE